MEIVDTVAHKDASRLSLTQIKTNKRKKKKNGSYARKRPIYSLFLFIFRQTRRNTTL